MVKKVKIAPNLDDIRRNGNVLECEYNDVHIKWVIAMDCSNISTEDETTLKQYLQAAIGTSSRLWQVPYKLNKAITLPSVVYVNDEVYNFPMWNR